MEKSKASPEFLCCLPEGSGKIVAMTISPCGEVVVATDTGGVYILVPTDEGQRNAAPARLS